jgi:DNA-binding NtrC family response regulator
MTHRTRLPIVPGNTSATLPGGTETVLLIDDDERLRALLRRVLEHYGYSVFEANDGDEAIELLAGYEGPIDLVITDVVMPGLTGRALVERLAAGRSPFKVLVISGYPQSDAVQHDVLALRMEFLAKPFEIADFVRFVRDLLDDERRRHWTKAS